MVLDVVLVGFSIILLLVGVLGFITPSSKALTSGAPAYNIFHLAFGALGLVLAAACGDAAARTFLIGFGAIDLYQAAASRLRWFPIRWFRWKRADDVLHVLVGAALIVVGIVAS